jgi:hypothetical protein
MLAIKSQTKSKRQQCHNVARSSETPGIGNSPGTRLDKGSGDFATNADIEGETAMALLRSFFMPQGSGARDPGDVPADCELRAEVARADSEGKDAARSGRS